MTEDNSRGMSQERTKPTKVIVGLGACGLAAGAQAVYDALAEGVREQGLELELARTGCIGLCEEEPLVDVIRPGEPRVTYGKMNPAKVRELVLRDLIGGETVESWVVGRILRDEEPYPEHHFYRGQRRLVLKNVGFIDPENVDDYVRIGGYAALKKALTELTPEEVIAEVKTSGLRGRGGAGFPAGRKWESTRRSEATKKYIVCNADEGDPGAFMDRAVMEGDPHRMLEGMALAGYAIGADEGYVYVRAEYPLAASRLRLAIQQAEAKGYLGEHILGTDFSFRIGLKIGAGAYVCGEATALVASMEGERGSPRPKPPHLAEHGFRGKPTNLNNVETYANVPTIVLEGGAAFAALGTEKSKGTKVFSLTGHVRSTGLAEVEMGMTLRQLVEEVGGGVPEGHTLKAVHIGGPAGGCLPAELLDTPIDYESLDAVGASMGSGGLTVLNEGTCMVDLARFFTFFMQQESCGKCIPCREGTKRSLEILERITAGEGVLEDLDRLERLGKVMKGASLCGLGQSAPAIVESTLRYYREEYLEHIREKSCRAGVCQALQRYRIIPELCIGCDVCRQKCPSGAITGQRGQVFVIVPERCTRCGDCQAVCPTEAVVRK